MGVHAGYLDRLIASVIDRSRQRLLQLFSALKNDTPVPRGLLTGSKGAATG